MSQENVTSFFKAIETDKVLKEKVAERLKMNKPEDDETAMEMMAEIASENGFVFGVNDMKSAAEQSDTDAELSDEMLNNVVGGNLLGWAALCGSYEGKKCTICLVPGLICILDQN